MNSKILGGLALAGLLAAGSAAHASNTDESREATALQGAKVTLSQAIAVAEQNTGGRAYEAGVEIKHGVARIAVETNGPKGVVTVVVDANTGRILGTHAGGEQD